MVGYHHQLRGHEPEQTPGDSEGQGRLACCSPQSRRVRHDLVTEQQQQQNNITTFIEECIPISNFKFQQCKIAISLHQPIKN